jgi:hypothetical protein
MKRISVLSLAAAFLFGSVNAADFELAGMKAKVPDGWKEENPTSTMRMAQFKLAKADGDKEDAELALFFFKGGSGSVDQNLKRQLAKFKPADGKEEPVNKTEKTKVGKIEATLQDVKGVYLSKFPPFAPNAKITEKTDWRQIYVIFMTDTGDYYMTLLGPAKTVARHEKAFKEWLASFK